MRKIATIDHTLKNPIVSDMFTRMARNLNKMRSRKAANARRREKRMRMKK